MCRLPDKAGAGSNSVAANGFPDSNQRRGVGQEPRGVCVCVWRVGRVTGKVAEVTLLTECDLFSRRQQAKDIKNTSNSISLFLSRLWDQARRRQ